MAMSVDQAIEALSHREKGEFQEAVCSLLTHGLRDFQTVPDSSGDGGLDGLSDRGTIAYQCYGPTQATRSKPAKERRKSYRRKFRDDLRKLYELVPDGTRGKKRLVHKDNKTLEEVLGSPYSNIMVIRICLNDYGDRALYGLAVETQRECKKYTQHRYVNEMCSIQVVGPKQICDWSSNFDVIFSPTQNLAGPTPSFPPHELREFDHKYDFLAARTDAARAEELKLQLKDWWIKALQHEHNLRTTSPTTHEDFIRVRRLAETEAQKSSITLISWQDKYKVLDQVKDFLIKHLTELLSSRGYSPAKIAEFASGEAARIVGTCHVDWRNDN